MLVVMDQKATSEQIDAVVAAIEAKGCTARPIPGGERVAIGVLRNEGPVDPSLFLGLPGVRDAVPVTRPYKLVSREFKPEDTIIQVGDWLLAKVPQIDQVLADLFDNHAVRRVTRKAGAEVDAWVRGRLGVK